MLNPADALWRIVTLAETEKEYLPGKTHFWHCKPGMVKDTNLMVVRATLPPGEAHRFHHHPHMEEVLYILSGTAEQWIEEEKRIMGPGDSIYLPKGLVHGTYNTPDDHGGSVATTTSVSFDNALIQQRVQTAQPGVIGQPIFRLVNDPLLDWTSYSIQVRFKLCWR